MSQSFVFSWKIFAKLSNTLTHNTFPRWRMEYLGLVGQISCYFLSCAKHEVQVRWSQHHFLQGVPVQQGTNGFRQFWLLWTLYYHGSRARLDSSMLCVKIFTRQISYRFLYYSDPSILNLVRIYCIDPIKFDILIGLDIR